MKTISVCTPTKTYNVHIGAGLLGRAGELSVAAGLSGSAAIVTDDNVDRLCADRLERSLKAAGFSTGKFVFPAGERSKNTSTLVKLLSRKISYALGHVFALGGGVVGDLAGLAAALSCAASSWQIPTTLLAAVDSSVGGKTAVDLDAGKNLAGAFYQPDLVICDTDTLSTLPKSEFSNGMAEVIKYAAIRDKSLYNALRPPISNLGAVIARCVEIKRDIVSADERDKGERQLLNFGHTFAHAIEKCSGYKIVHGSAVAIGMAMMTRACRARNICGGDCLEVLLDALDAYGLPAETGYDEDALFSALLSDKKRNHDRITLVVPRGPGRCERLSVTLPKAREFLRLGLMKG